MIRNAFAVMAPPRTPLGELRALPDPLAGGDGAHCSSPKTDLAFRAFAFRPFGPHAAALEDDSCSLGSMPLYRNNNVKHLLLVVYCR